MELSVNEQGTLGTVKLLAPTTWLVLTREELALLFAFEVLLTTGFDRGFGADKPPPPPLIVKKSLAAAAVAAWKKKKLIPLQYS
jgi:hypothetical protein